jgi:oxygen-independent coproporphyrinogen-3 oxidase
VKQAQDAGLTNLNLDLMYALPLQDLDAAAGDIDEALALRPAHISHYQLTLEPNTLFAAQPPPLPDDDAAWDMQEHCQAQLAAAGYAQYEVSAYARDEQRCAHNLNYWNFGDYLGIGAGAHGKITTRDGAVHRRAKKKLPRSYLAETRIASDETLARDRVPFEFLLNALRLNDGFALADFERRTALSRAAIDAPLADAAARGWLEVGVARVVPTELGRRFLNDVIELFM